MSYMKPSEFLFMVVCLALIVWLTIWGIQNATSQTKEWCEAHGGTVLGYDCVIVFQGRPYVITPNDRPYRP